MRRIFYFSGKEESCGVSCNLKDWHLLPSIHILKHTYPFYCMGSEVNRFSYVCRDFFFSFLCFTFYCPMWGKVKEKKK